MNSCPFREFKDIFGRPGKGIHAYRIFDTALVDYILSLLGAMLITYLDKYPVGDYYYICFSSRYVSPHLVWGQYGSRHVSRL